jgi:hypothetical protein
MEFLIVSVPQNDVVAASMAASEADQFMQMVANKITDFNGHIILIGEVHSAPSDFCCCGTHGAEFNSLVAEAASHKANTVIFVSNWNDLNQKLSKVICKYSGSKKSNVTIVGLGGEIWIAKIVSICNAIDVCNYVEVQFPTCASFENDVED